MSTAAQDVVAYARCMAFVTHAYQHSTKTESVLIGCIEPVMAVYVSLEVA